MRNEAEPLRMRIEAEPLRMQDRSRAPADAERSGAFDRTARGKVRHGKAPEGLPNCFFPTRRKPDFPSIFLEREKSRSIFISEYSGDP